MSHRCASCSHVNPIPPCDCTASVQIRTAASHAYALADEIASAAVAVVLLARLPAQGVERKHEAGAAALDAHRHVGALVLDRLEGADRAAELPAHLRIRRGLRHGSLGHAHGVARHRESSHRLHPGDQGAGGCARREHPGLGHRDAVECHRAEPAGLVGAGRVGDRGLPGVDGGEQRPDDRSSPRAATIRSSAPGASSTKPATPSMTSRPCRRAQVMAQLACGRKPSGPPATTAARRSPVTRVGSISAARARFSPPSSAVGASTALETNGKGTVRRPNSCSTTAISARPAPTPSNSSGTISPSRSSSAAVRHSSASYPSGVVQRGAHPFRRGPIVEQVAHHGAQVVEFVHRWSP